MALIMSLTFVPAAMNILRYPPVLEQKINRRTNRLLMHWGRFFIRYKKIFLIGCLTIIVFFAVRIPSIIVDTNPIHYWREDSEIRISNEIIDRNFGGSSQLAILAEGDIKDPTFLEKIESLTDYLSQDSIVTQTVSIVDQIRQMNQAFHGDSAFYDAIPKSRDIVAQYLFLYSITGGPGDLDHLVDYEYRQAQVMARVNSNSSSDLYRLFKNTERYVRDHLSSEEFPNITGMVAIIGELADLVVLGQVRSLIISIVLVAILSGLIFRSVIMGLLSIVPLSGAVIFVFGVMGYSGTSLNIATAMLSSIMIGVGIDYTIHFLYRFRTEVESGLNSSEAVIKTLITTGKGIIYNALSVIVGFTVLMLSGFEPIFFFGFLIVFSITACLFGALAVMPALLVWIRAERFFQKENRNDG